MKRGPQQARAPGASAAGRLEDRVGEGGRWYPRKPGQQANRTGQAPQRSAQAPTRGRGSRRQNANRPKAWSSISLPLKPSGGSCDSQVQTALSQPMHLPTPSQSSRSMGNEGGTFHGGHPSCASKSILLFRRPQAVGVILVPSALTSQTRKAHTTPHVGGLSAERRVASGMGSREQPEATPVVPPPKRGSLPQLVETPTRNPSQRAIRGKPDIHDTSAFYDAYLPRARGKHDIPDNRP